MGTKGFVQCPNDEALLDVAQEAGYAWSFVLGSTGTSTARLISGKLIILSKNASTISKLTTRRLIRLMSLTHTAIAFCPLVWKLNCMSR